MPSSQKRTRDGRTIFHLDPATLRPDEIAVCDSFERIVEDVHRYDSNLAAKLALMKWLFNDLRASYQLQPSGSSFISATSFDSVKKAADAVEVVYDRNGSEHVWHLREKGHLSNGELSSWAGKNF
jgi:hypothetical protein